MKIPCTSCKKEIEANSEFCSHCGAKQNVVALDLTKRQRIGIFLGSFFLAPFGIYWFLKYFKDDKIETRKVAYISLIITLVAVTLTIVIAGRYLSAVSNIIEIYKRDLNVYSELGL